MDIDDALEAAKGAQEGLGKTAHPERLGPGVSDAERKQRPAFPAVKRSG